MQSCAALQTFERCMASVQRYKPDDHGPARTSATALGFGRVRAIATERDDASSVTVRDVRRAPL